MQEAAPQLWRPAGASKKNLVYARVGMISPNVCDKMVSDLTHNI